MSVNLRFALFYSAAIILFIVLTITSLMFEWTALWQRVLLLSVFIVITHIIDYNMGTYYHRWGSIYLHRKKFDQAITAYSKAIKNNSRSQEAYNYRGIAFHGKEMYDQAIEDYNQALALNPNYAEVYYNRGCAYHFKKMPDQAIEDYNEALAFQPVSGFAAFAYNNRGAAFLDKEMFDQAIDDCSKAIKLKHKFANAYYSRGKAYVGKGRTGNALADFKAFLTYAAPGDSNIDNAQKHLQELDG
ncbi:MAG: tetratricopeptide repeat protein [Negativicutes bacterium]|nr:tetratricopeptide repeat protein [Negativicutes bacterium]